jgi:N-formylglutamate amidohydrolase
MIEGLKVDLTADELACLLEERVCHHREVAADCDTRRIRLQAVTAPNPDDTEEQLAAAWPPYLENLERRADRHRDRAGALQFLRDHLIAREIYRLGEEELELLRLWPEDTKGRVPSQEAE